MYDGIDGNGNPTGKRITYENDTLELIKKTATTEKTDLSVSFDKIAKRATAAEQVQLTEITDEDLPF